MKKLLPIYCLLGEDVYRKREFLSEVKARLLASDNNSLNYEYLVGAETPVSRVLDAARTPAWDLFSAGSGDQAGRLVVVDGAEAFSANDWKKMADYFQAPDPGTCLVFLVNQPSNKWSGKNQLPPRYRVNYAPLKKEKLRAWIEKEAARRGLHLSPKQVAQCSQAAGDDLGALAGGLEKLAIYQGPAGGVRDRDIRELLGGGREGTVFNLTDLAVTGRTGEAILLLNRLLDESEPPLRLFALMASSLRKLWQGVDAWERTRNSAATVEAAGLRFFQEAFLRQVKSISTADIPFWYRRMVETDAALKGEEKNPRLALERFLIDLAAGPGAGGLRKDTLGGRKRR